MKKKLMALALAFTMVLGTVSGPIQVFAEGASQDTKTITILHTNDVHGHIVPQVGKDGKLKEIGFAKVKTYADSIKNAVLLDAGDVSHGTALAGVNKGKDVINLMKAMGYKAMAPGNHDFNYGYDALVGFKNQALPKEGSKEGFDILAANVIRATGGNDFKGQTIIDVDGVKVGVFGLATEETKVKSNPKNTENVMFLNPIDVARAQVQSLKDQKVDVIVMLCHIGIDDSTLIKSSDIAKAVDGIDVIIDGHSHTRLDKGQMVNNTLIAQTGKYMENLGEVNITLRGHDIISKNAVLKNAAFFENVKEDPAIKGMIDKVLADNKDALEKVVGKTAVTLDGEREHVRASETNFGNLMADAMREISGADVAFTNGGGIRTSIPAGDINMTQLWTAFPFGNTIMKIELTGADILEALEFGVGDAPAPNGKFPQISGMTFKYDAKQKVGERVFDVKIAGKALDPKAKYTLATNDFMANGGDGYKSFAKGKKIADYGLYTEVLEKYLATKGTVDPKKEDRIVPAAKHATKPEEKQPAEGFTDIKGHWAEKVIKSVTEKKLFAGMTATTFEPNTKISRGMLVSVLARLEGQDKKQKAVHHFKDVKAGDWYENSVIWAQKNKIVAGYEDGTFKPNQAVSREEMGAILGRYIESKGIPFTLDLKAPFADQKHISKWAENGIDVTRHAGVMTGRDGNMFAPKAHATRAELAQVMFNLERLVSANKDLKPVDHKEAAKPGEKAKVEKHEKTKTEKHEKAKEGKHETSAKKAA